MSKLPDLTVGVPFLGQTYPCKPKRAPKKIWCDSPFNKDLSVEVAAALSAANQRLAEDSRAVRAARREEERAANEPPPAARRKSSRQVYNCVC